MQKILGCSKFIWTPEGWIVARLLFLHEKQVLKLQFCLLCNGSGFQTRSCVTYIYGQFLLTKPFFIFLGAGCSSWAWSSTWQGRCAACSKVVIRFLEEWLLISLVLDHCLVYCSSCLQLKIPAIVTLKLHVKG